MPFFKSTFNILSKCDEDEVFNRNWMDSDKVILPPRLDWDYKREMTIEDVDIWEVLYEASGGIGLYAAWLPYAEFYMITAGFRTETGPHYFQRSGETPYWDRHIETFYAKGAQSAVRKRAKELGIVFTLNDVWVDDEDMWIYR
jgi:hypothetical protein